MKNNFKIIGASIISFILGSVTIVCANQAIQAVQNTEIKVDLDGQIHEFRDEKTGEIQYPITYNNRTYLPLRNVAQLAGLYVNYDSDSKTAYLKSNDSVIYSNEDILNQEKIRQNIANELEKANPNFYNNNYFELVAKIDINNDGKSEYIIIVEPNSESFNMRFFSHDGEEIKEGLEEMSQIVDCLEVRKDGDKTKLFVETSFGDGLCYESDTIYEVKLVDNKFQVKTLGSYTCDEEEETRKRSALGNGASIEDEASAHTLKYIVDDKVVSKEEYDNVIKEYKDIHELVKKIK